MWGGKTKAQKEATKLLANAATLYCMLFGGSRSGKTFLIVRSIFMRALKYPHSRHLMLRLRFSHAKQSLWHDTIPKVMRLCFPTLRGKDKIVLNKQDWFIELFNGSQIWIGGLDEKERVEKILGNEYSTIYFNEASQLGWGSVRVAVTRLAQKIPNCKKKLYFDCNPPNKRHWIYTLWMQKLDPVTNRPLAKPHLYTSFRMNPADNVENIGEDYINDILDTLTDRDKKRYRDGEFLDDAEGALFSYRCLARDRVLVKEDGVGEWGNTLAWARANCDEVVVAVDPAVTNSEASDEHGIVVVGWNRAREEAMVLEDGSGKGSARWWAEEAQRLYEKWEANMVVGEVNNGGDLVEVNLRTVSILTPFEAVRASKGKAVRTEPVASLSEKGKLRMVGEFPMLEEECTSYVPNLGMRSPNRMDAMVWGVSRFLRKKKRVGSWAP